MDTALVIGTCDTKGAELKYMRDILRLAGLEALLIDVSTRGSDPEADIGPAAVAAFHPDGAGAVLELGDRGKAVGAMAVALIRFLASRKAPAGVIAAGGSGGTALVAPALRSLRIGLPKVLVSTVASGNVAPYVGASDIQMIYSVTDIAGLNRISRVILANAAHALAGMIKGDTEIPAASKPAIGLTMFGVTTPCVEELVRRLSPDYDCLVFHATGTGGQSFEALADSGLISGALDITTTEVCDLLFGGVFAATPDRFGAFIRTGMPYVGSCGALDMVNFGAIDTVPAKYAGRLLHVHNANVTLMRTTAAENAEIGAWIARRLNACNGPVQFLIPEKGVSALDAPGQSFFDAEADAALFGSIEANFNVTPDRQLTRLPLHINDPAFAAAALAAFTEIM